MMGDVVMRVVKVLCAKLILATYLHKANLMQIRFFVLLVVVRFVMMMVVVMLIDSVDVNGDMVYGTFVCDSYGDTFGDGE